MAAIMWFAAFTGVIGGFGSLVLSFAKDIINDRAPMAIPAVMHFHNTNLTAANLKVLNHVYIEPQGDDKVMFRNGDFEASGKMTLLSAGNGTGHGTISIEMDRNGQPFVEQGKWIAVDMSDRSKAANETKVAFKELQDGLENAGEAGLLTFLRALETISSTFADNVSEMQ